MTKYIIERESTTNQWNILKQRPNDTWQTFINLAPSLDEAMQWVKQHRSHEFYKRHPHEITIICGD